ncbi:MAG TPA: class I SAM-dependent methyltransferase [Thermoleophilia bacterium]|nr:class I SAM-dependent methyltransferase [Thermoleophilia bacterium]
MFHDIPGAIRARMAQLEEIDARDRRDGTARLERLRQVPREVGRFVALLAAGAPPGRWIEIGTSAGYSTLWLALACREVGARVTTFEVLDAKAALARETFALAGVDDVVEFVHADVREHLAGLDGIAFCFLDSEKADYGELYEAVVPRLVPGGLLVADNAVGFEDVMQPMLDGARADARVDAVLVRFLTGQLICRKR